ncbi:MAG TPA: trehalose-phosphatase [Nevskiaceae bacterium]|nr:trehalose-phosphatase [Nevskiaceae bacterium]
MQPILDPEHAHLLGAYALPGTLIAFDYDGTLAPIVREPAHAHMRPRTRELLTLLARRFPVAVISGRGRADVLRLLAGVPLVEVVGNHGAESLTALPDEIVARVRAWRAQLQPVLAQLPGSALEDKGWSLAIHYRGCADAAAAAQAVRTAASTLPRARLVPGKAVLNVVSDDAPDKGAALLDLQRRAHCVRILFAGDDDTDDDVFRLQRAHPILGIQVGARATSLASYALRAQLEIDPLLERLLGADARAASGPAAAWPVALASGRAEARYRARTFVTESTMSAPVYALNLFDVSSKEEYMAYSRRSAREVAAHGGRVVALGKFREVATGEIQPRQVLILVEWQSKAAFDSYCNDPALADLHPHRVNGTRNYIWHLYDRLDDLRPLLK